MKPWRFVALDIGADGLCLAVFARRREGRIELLDHAFAPFDAEPPAEMTYEAVVATTVHKLLALGKAAAGVRRPAEECHPARSG